MTINDHKVISYVLCIDDGGYPESLEPLKVYPVLADDQAALNNHIRIIDETGEDYLYPAKYFVPIQIPPEASNILAAKLKTNSTVEVRYRERVY
jgi:hypothetical protein